MPLKQQIETIQKSSVFIAMHGSALANTIFLQKGSIVIEMFPYGFERPTYEYTICNKAGMHYYKWKNPSRDNTVFHPEVLDSFGISGRERENIISAEKHDIKMSWAANKYWMTQVRYTRLYWKYYRNIVADDHRSSATMLR
jgi:hypothetical protein